MKARSIIGSVLAAVVIFQSCTKDETSAPQVTLVQKIVKDVPADTIVGLSPIGQPVGVGKFTFYSFETNSIVPNSDSNSTKWDVGVRGTTIITSGGTSGPGKGGAFIYVGTFDDLTTVPADSTFKVDAAPSYAITAGSNKGWYV
nr:HmuY family protein [Chitinophagaceae bacterium]